MANPRNFYGFLLAFMGEWASWNGVNPKDPVANRDFDTHLTPHSGRRQNQSYVDPVNLTQFFFFAGKCLT